MDRYEEEERKQIEDTHLWGVVEEVGREVSASNEATISIGKEGFHNMYAKEWRVKKNKPRVTLGRDVGMQEVGMISARGLVGRFGYRALGAREIHRWVEVTWNPMLGYLPEVFILTRGWFCFIFKSLEDVENILNMYGW
jgi:hypothetical protein